MDKPLDFCFGIGWALTLTLTLTGWQGIQNQVTPIWHPTSGFWPLENYELLAPKWHSFNYELRCQVTWWQNRVNPSDFWPLASDTWKICGKKLLYYLLAVFAHCLCGLCEKKSFPAKKVVSHFARKNHFISRKARKGKDSRLLMLSGQEGSPALCRNQAR